MNADTRYRTLYELHERTIEVMEDVKNTIKTLNDRHRETDNLIAANTAALREMVAVNRQYNKFIRLLTFALVAAIIVLAGAEKALKFVTF